MNDEITSLYKRDPKTTVTSRVCLVCKNRKFSGVKQVPRPRDIVFKCNHVDGKYPWFTMAEALTLTCDLFVHQDRKGTPEYIKELEATLEMLRDVNYELYDVLNAGFILEKAWKSEEGIQEAKNTLITALYEFKKGLNNG